MRTIDLVAATCILGSDRVLRNPGDRWPCPAAEAEGLIASGAATPAEEAPPASDGPDAAGALTAVSGIGPSAAAALQAAGVKTLADLATLKDEEIAGLELGEKIRRRIRDDWRGQAAELLDAGEAPS
ncbi:MAG: helix-hairpin-helix domain-containing protein [Acidobacteriota bacterium]|nr:helix-hairpin-helix domain-containing protein [Acidobacteriota bacterium]